MESKEEGNKSLLGAANQGALSASPDRLPDEGPETDAAISAAAEQLHALSIRLLHELLKHMDRLNGVGGLRAIPFLQTLLLLCSRLDDSSQDGDKQALQAMLDTCLKQLAMEEEVGLGVCAYLLLTCNWF